MSAAFSAPGTLRFADEARQAGDNESVGASAHASKLECLHELFEAQADRRPEALAIACGERTLSYSAVELRANQMAHYLRRFGVGPGAFVGIAFERSELPIISILACLKAGAAYVPLDQSHPDERIRYILEETGAAVVLTEQARCARLCNIFSGRVISVDDAPELASASASRLSRADLGLSPSDLCYIIYTSGTTGQPKGIMTEHRSVVHFARAFNKVCGTTPEDRKSVV